MPSRVQRVILLRAPLALLCASGAAVAGPPLLTNDPDTPGPGAWEINLAATGDRTYAAFLPAHYLKKFHPSYTKKDDLDKLVAASGFKTWTELFAARNAVRSRSACG